MVGNAVRTSILIAVVRHADERHHHALILSDEDQRVEAKNLVLDETEKVFAERGHSFCLVKGQQAEGQMHVLGGCDEDEFHIDTTIEGLAAPESRKHFLTGKRLQFRAEFNVAKTNRTHSFLPYG